ncbi:LysR family transcriptional regulator [Phyllobacterium phragmitis]|uniref:LysR family transcriptional regulator n=1 Tax=Phyllobacterium phragmitis TaxID=2670329 RepID=UPI001FE14645|nr:LysR family transcriptional regulator [Phyllobacterium phragmitis]
MTIAEHHNFRHAAAALGISQSSISQRIKQLESDLGILLFERRPRGIIVTEAGRHFLEQVAIGVDHLAHAVRMAGKIANGRRGRLQIGLHGVFISGALARLLQCFRRQYPDVEIDIADGQRQNVLRQIHENRSDIAFLFGEPRFPGCHSWQLWKERFLVVLPTHHALADKEELNWTDLASKTFLVRHDGVGPQVLEHVIQRFDERGIQACVRRLDVGRDTLMRMVAERYGVTLVPESATAIAIPGIIFRPLNDQAASISVTAVWSPFNQNPPLRDFLTLMRRSNRTEIELPLKSPQEPVFSLPAQRPDQSL